MAQDNSPYIRQRAQLERKKSGRASHDRVLIVSEGKKTEPLYFEEIRRTYRLHTANIEVRKSEFGTQPKQVVEYARELFLNGDRHRKIAPRAFERVFAVFDRDEHRTYHEALSLAESLNGKLLNDAKQKIEFQAIASVPCFELWLLLHFEHIQHPLHRNDALQRLKQHIPGYEKGLEGTFRLTKDKLNVASMRARSLAANTAHHGNEPYTNVDFLVNLLRSFE
ncbi:MAG: RloB domain-containing protein [Alphaproteobacteria bacterium]|nr:MAG: RloB domain-containing protein [Alphaproteobacteria bacterium]